LLGGRLSLHRHGRGRGGIVLFTALGPVVVGDLHKHGGKVPVGHGHNDVCLLEKKNMWQYRMQKMFDCKEDRLVLLLELTHVHRLFQLGLIEVNRPPHVEVLNDLFLNDKKPDYYYCSTLDSVIWSLLR
jgi:hypothetical protein